WQRGDVKRVDQSQWPEGCLVGVEHREALQLDVLDGRRLCARARDRHQQAAQRGECRAREAESPVDWPEIVAGWLRNCPTHSAQLSDSSSRHSSRAENSAKRVRTSCAVHSRKIHADARRTSPATKWTRPAVIGPSWRVSRYTDQVVPPRARSPMCAALLRSMVSGGVVIGSAAGRFSTVAPEAPPRQTVAGVLSAYIAR